MAIAFAMRLDDNDVASIRIGLGGVAATPLRALATEEALLGRPWTGDVVAEAADVLGAEGPPLSDHRSSARFRVAMLRTSLLKFHAENPAATFEEVR